MSTLRVLHCIYDHPDNPWVGGGGARRAFGLYRHLGHRVDATILTGRFPGAREPETLPTVSPGHRMRVRHAGVSGPYVASRLSFSIAASRALMVWEYDVAVVDHSGYAPILVPRDRPVGTIVHHLAGPGAETRWGSWTGQGVGAIERAVLRRARAFSATSAASEAAVREIVGDRVRITRVASGVPDGLFAQPHRDSETLLYIGRLDVAHKGLDVLVDAFARVVDAHPAARLLIAGRGSDDASLRRAVDARSLTSRVEFLGGVSDADRADLLSSAGGFVMPSRFEGFGIATAEALAAGVPIIVSDVPALRDLAVGEGHDPRGLVVPPGDAEALAGAMRYLLLDASRRIAMGHAGRRFAERFRWSTVADAHLRFLLDIAAANPRDGKP